MEFLVLLACGTGKGCSETANQYYVSNPAVAMQLQNIESNVKQKAGPLVVNVVGPVVGYASGNSGVFKVDKFLSLQVSRSIIGLKFERSF